MKLTWMKELFPFSRTLWLIVLFLQLSFHILIYAHCDSMEGPVVKACKKALETENVNYVLIWIQETDEQVIRDAFQRTLKVRTLGDDAKELADMYFFETVVRIHRKGEGEPYTGLKPAGYKIPHGIAAADLAIESGSVDEILAEQPNEVHQEILDLFTEVQRRKNYDINDVKAGRDFVKSYVHLIHFIEGLYGEEDHPEVHQH